MAQEGMGPLSSKSQWQPAKAGPTGVPSREKGKAVIIVTEAFIFLMKEVWGYDRGAVDQAATCDAGSPVSASSSPGYSISTSSC